VARRKQVFLCGPSLLFVDSAQGAPAASPFLSSPPGLSFRALNPGLNGTETLSPVSETLTSLRQVRDTLKSRIVRKSLPSHWRRKWRTFTSFHPSIHNSSLVKVNFYSFGRASPSSPPNPSPARTLFMSNCCKVDRISKRRFVIIRFASSPRATPSPPLRTCYFLDDDFHVTALLSF